MTKKVAQVMGKYNNGLIDNAIINYYKYINKDKYQFDFIYEEGSLNIPQEEIEKLGGKVIITPSHYNTLKYKKELTKVLDNDYDIIHVHLNNYNILPLYIANKLKSKVIIAHNYLTFSKLNIFKIIIRSLVEKYATDYMACTDEAGIDLFGRDNFNCGKVYILNKAIDIKKFTYDEELRINKRKDLGINNSTLVIGNIGLFKRKTNHLFTLKVFSYLHDIYANSILILGGIGSLEDSIKDNVNELGLTDAVKFLDNTNDLKEIYQAIDVFIYPALNTDISLPVIEAQACGLPCVISANNSINVKITNEVKFISLKDKIDTWVNLIIDSSHDKRVNNNKEIKKARFEIKDEVKKLEEKYEELIK